MEEVKRSIVISCVATLIVLLLAGNMDLVRAVGMSSSSYKIQSDSLNFGGSQGNSASYKVEDTLGEIATGDSSSASYNLHAGYQQMHESYIAFDDLAPDVTMTPALGGLTGGTSNGSTAVTVVTDNAAGYVLYIKASSSPAMQGNTTADSIADYEPVVPSFPDYDFDITHPSQARFGFSPEGVDTATEFLDDGATCNQIFGGSDTADKCWDGLSTSDKTIARRYSPNHPSGSSMEIKFRVAVGSSSFKLEDTYTATTTVTAIAL